MKGIVKFYKTKRLYGYLVNILVLLFVLTTIVYAVSVPNKFTAGTTAKSSEVNDNFDYLAKRVWELTGGDLYYINGYIGIGTTSPETELEVIGTVTATAFVGDGSGLTGIIPGNGLDSEDGSITDAVYVNNEGKVGIGTTSPSANADLTLEKGILCLKETTAPTGDTDYGKLFTKSDNGLYFQDGAGTEHKINFGTDLITTSPLTIYVRTDGNDSNDGLSDTPERAKSTLEGALSVIPRIVNHDVTIQFADGEYDMSAYKHGNNNDLKIDSIICSGDHAIMIKGNASNREAVTLQGSTSTYYSWLWIKGSIRIKFYYIRLDNIMLYVHDRSYLCLNTAVMIGEGIDGSLIYANNYVDVEINSCKFRPRMNSHYTGAILINNHCNLFIANVDAQDVLSKETIFIMIGGNSTFTICDGSIGSTYDNFRIGVAIGCTGADSDNITTGGCQGRIDSDYNALHITNCNTGIKMGNFSHAFYRNAKPTYSGNTNDERIQEGSTYRSAQF